MDIRGVCGRQGHLLESFIRGSGVDGQSLSLQRLCENSKAESCTHSQPKLISKIRPNFQSYDCIHLEVSFNENEFDLHDVLDGN
jgi:hypothetical protein